MDLDLGGTLIPISLGGKVVIPAELNPELGSSNFEQHAWVRVTPTRFGLLVQKVNFKEIPHSSGWLKKHTRNSLHRRNLQRDLDRYHASSSG
ncbi:MAG: hypothetical protein ABSA33_06230 [Candidatus Micrarchaeaceae archaeon]